MLFRSTISYSLSSIYGVAVSKSTIQFSGSPGTNNVNATNNPQIVNNTGNTAFTAINITAFNLKSGSNYIGAGNFTANVTDASGAGHTLGNNTQVQLAGSSVAVQATKNVYIYMNIPTGAANGTYTPIQDWVVTIQ